MASSSIVKKNRGRQRVEMVKMENDSNRQVTFSKRRGGLFKKASELCTLCGVEIAIIVFSPGRKSFSFGHPSVEMITNRYLIDSSPNHNECGQCSGARSSSEDGVVGELNDEFGMVNSRMEMEKKRCEEINGMKKQREGEDLSRFITWLEAPMKVNRREKRIVAHKMEYVEGMMNELKRKVIIEGRRFMVEFPNVAPSFLGAMDGAAAAAAFASGFDAANNFGPFAGGLGYGGMGF